MSKEETRDTVCLSLDKYHEIKDAEERYKKEFLEAKERMDSEIEEVKKIKKELQQLIDDRTVCIKHYTIGADKSKSILTTIIPGTDVNGLAEEVEKTTIQNVIEFFDKFIKTVPIKYFKDAKKSILKGETVGKDSTFMMLLRSHIKFNHNKQEENNEK